MKHKTDEDGRQRLSFFVKTVHAQDDTPQAATFVSCDTNKMETSFDGSLYDEETVGDIRGELDEKINNFKDEMKVSLSEMFKRLVVDIQSNTASQVQSAIDQKVEEARQEQLARERREAEQRAFAQATREAEAAAALIGCRKRYKNDVPDHIGS